MPDKVAAKEILIAYFLFLARNLLEYREGSMSTALKCCFGFAVCTGVALFLSKFLSDGGEIRLAAPALCLLVVISTSMYWGRLAGLIGSVAASLTLAYLLYPPDNSFAVQEPAAQIVLILFQLSAIGAVLITPRHPGPDSKWNGKPRRGNSDALTRLFLGQRNSD